MRPAYQEVSPHAGDRRSTRVILSTKPVNIVRNREPTRVAVRRRARSIVGSAHDRSRGGLIDEPIADGGDPLMFLYRRQRACNHPGITGAGALPSPRCRACGHTPGGRRWQPFAGQRSCVHANTIYTPANEYVCVEASCMLTLGTRETAPAWVRERQAAKVAEAPTALMTTLPAKPPAPAPEPAADKRSRRPAARRG